jgi:hypothetical protein
MNRPDPEYLHEILYLDHIQGFLRWKVSPAAIIRAGDPAGSAAHRGSPSNQISILGHRYAHRHVLSAMQAGEWPSEAAVPKEKAALRARPTPDELRQMFHYDPESGFLYWKVRASRRIQIGDVAGVASAKEKGRITVGISGRLFRAHVIAWAVVTGVWPENEIDHRDENPGNNKWKNLREASKSQNTCNIRHIKSNTSGYKGVSYDKKRNKYAAKIKKDGKIAYLGRFNTPWEASAAYQAACKLLHKEFAKF